MAEQVATNIYRFNRAMLQRLASHYIVQCKSRVDARLIKEFLEDLESLFQLKDDRDYAVVPIKNSEPEKEDPAKEVLKD